MSNAFIVFVVFFPTLQSFQNQLHNLKFFADYIDFSIERIGHRLAELRSATHSIVPRAGQIL